MMGKVVGYMEGTDPLWLTSLSALSYTTRPLSNGFDNHGMHVQLITEQRKVDLIICYLHKIIPTPGEDVSAGDLLSRAKIFDIPVLVVCPKELHELGRSKAGNLPPNAILVDPADVMAKISELLKKG